MVDDESEDEVKEEDEEMPESAVQVKDIQLKLQQKVLPILERHLTDVKNTQTDEQPIIRSFVVLSILKVIRKLPLHSFQNGLNKLVSTIVSKGLRQKGIACRDKGRKALVKLLTELSPRTPTLTIVF